MGNEGGGGKRKRRVPTDVRDRLLGEIDREINRIKKAHPTLNARGRARIEKLRKEADRLMKPFYAQGEQ